MRLFSQVDDMLEVGVIYVGVHSKQPLEDRLGDGYEVPREGHTCRGGGGAKANIIIIITNSHTNHEL